MLGRASAGSMEPTVRVLYLGNDLKLIATVRQVLAEPVYRLVTCVDRESAVLLLKSEISSEVLLIDLQWRGKNGLEVVRLARKIPHRKRMPIVLLANTKLNRRRQTVAAEAGVTTWMLKTEDVGEGIKRVIGQIVSIRRFR